jgi:ankyrin repeat protein
MATTPGDPNSDLASLKKQLKAAERRLASLSKQMASIGQTIGDVSSTITNLQAQEKKQAKAAANTALPAVQPADEQKPSSPAESAKPTAQTEPAQAAKREAHPPAQPAEGQKQFSPRDWITGIKGLSKVKRRAALAALPEEQQAAVLEALPLHAQELSISFSSNMDNFTTMLRISRAESGRTAEEKLALSLFKAIRDDDVASVNSLMAAGARLDFQNFQKLTPLALACLSVRPNAEEIARMLALADPNLASAAGKKYALAVLRYADNSGKPEISKLISERLPKAAEPPKPPAPQIDTPRTEPTLPPKARLRRAIYNGDLEGVRGFLAQESEFVGKPALMLDALREALSAQNIGILRLLLENGADPSKADLSEPCYATRNMEIIRLMVQNGAKLGPISEKQFASFIDPFHGIRAMDEEFLNFLIERNGELMNYREKSTHYTPLMWAVKDRNIWLVEFLIKHGADLNATQSGKWGDQDALSLAYRYDFLPAADLLIEKGAKINEKLLANAFHFAGLESARVMISRHGIDVNITTFTGFTALMAAAGRGDVKLIAFLLSKGADPNARTKGGWTPLSFAVRLNSYEATELLIKAGANANISLPYRERTFPYHDKRKFVLETACERRNERLVRLLVEGGADLGVMFQPREFDDGGSDRLLVRMEMAGNKQMADLIRQLRRNQQKELREMNKIAVENMGGGSSAHVVLAPPNNRPTMGRVLLLR